MEWTPNATQKQFLEVLSEEPHTLAELGELAGCEFKTGTVNALVKKGLVAHGDDKQIVCPMCGRKHTVKTWVKA